MMIINKCDVLNMEARKYKTITVTPEVYYALLKRKADEEVKGTKDVSFGDMISLLLGCEKND